MLINLKSLSPVPVMISSMSVLICNRFHTTQANNGKITSFREYPSLMPSFKRNPRTQGHEISSRKTRDLEAAHSKDFVILASTVFDTAHKYDRQTDGLTDAQAMAKTREAFCYRA